MLSKQILGLFQTRWMMSYYMHVEPDKIPNEWMCEECTMRSECQKSGSPVNLDSWHSSKSKSKYSHAWKRQTEGISSTSHSSAKRHGVPSKAQPLKKDRVIKMSAASPRSSQPCNNAVLHKDLSCKNFNGKAKSTKDVTSELQVSYDSQEKAKVPHACGDKRRAGTLEVELHGKRRAVETRTTFSEASKPSNKSLLNREPPFKKLGKMTVVFALPVCSVKQSSYVSKKKPKLPSRLGEESPKLDSQTEKTKGILANAYCPLVFKDLKSAETETDKGKCVSELHNPATHLLASEKAKTTISRDETFFSGSNSFGLDAVQSCGPLGCRLQPNSHNVHKGQYFLNEEKKNESWQAERPSEAAAAIKLDKLCTSLVSDEYSKFEAAILSKRFTIPRPDYIWLGKFQIHISEGTASTCDGIQAHLSTHASQKVSEVVGRLPDVIVLEELPRSGCGQLNLWKVKPQKKILLSTFWQNILISWNKLLFLWGVFRGRKINNSANTPLSNSPKSCSKQREVL